MVRKRRNASRRSFLKYGGSVTGIAALAGCTGDGGDGGGDGGDGGSGGGDGGDGGSGGSTGGSGVEGPVKVGVVAPLDAPVGMNIEASANIAIDEINNNGGIGGAELELVALNNNYDAQQTVSRYQELTTGENVDLTMGPYVSENQLAIMQNIAQTGTLHMGVAAGTPRATQHLAEDFERYRNFFRVGPLNGHYRGKEMVKFASENLSTLGWERVAVLVEDFAWTEPISAVLNDELSGATEAEIVMNRRFSGDTNDFSPLFDEAESNGADGILTAIAHIGTSFIVQWSDQERPLGMAGVTVPAEDPTYWSNTDGKCAFVVGSLFGGVDGAYITEKGAELAQKWGDADAYGGSPMYPGFHTYDAINMFTNAANEAGSVASEDLIPILEGVSHDGTAGTVEFYGQDHEYPHDVKRGEDLIHEMQYQWQPEEDGGTQVGIAPSELAEGDYVQPEWL